MNVALVEPKVNRIYFGSTASGYGNFTSRYLIKIGTFFACHFQALFGFQKVFNLGDVGPEDG